MGGLLTGTALSRAAKQEVDTAVGVGVGIGGEVEVRYAPQIQAGSELVTEKMPGVFEGGDGIAFLAVGNRNTDVGMAHIGRNFRGCDRDRADAGIRHLEGDQFGDLLANGFGDAPGAVFIHGERYRAEPGLQPFGRLFLQPLGVCADEHGAEEARGFLLDRLQYL